MGVTPRAHTPVRLLRCADAERQAPVEETAGAKPGVASSLSSWWRRVLRREEVSPSVPAPVPEGGPPSSSDTAPATLTVVEEQCSSSTGDIARLSVSRPGGERSKGDKGVHRTGSQGSMGRRSDPVCLICLETLTSEEFRVSVSAAAGLPNHVWRDWDATCTLPAGAGAT